MWLLYGFLVLLAAVVGASAFFKQSAPQIRLEGKRVLVTGGSSGIGLVLAEMLLREGASVTIVARDKAKLAEAVKQLDKARRGTSQVIHSVSADVSDYPSISKAVDEAAAKMGGLDIYVGSAGNSRPGRFLDIPIEDFERQTKINYLGNVYTIRAAVPHMKKAGGGRVMIISSMAGLTGVAGFSAYSPPKFALRGLAEVLHMELRPFNIHVSMCNPPDVDTPGLAEEMKFKPQECKLISEGIGLFTAQHIAGDIISSLKKWQFFVHSGFEGQLSKHLSAAMSPPSSVLDSVIQFFFAGPLRLIGLGYIYSYYSIVDKVYRQEKLVK